jgi:hypothetical protein
MRAALLFVVVLAGVAQAQLVVSQPGVGFATPYDGAPMYCSTDVRVFETLRHGPFHYCRKKLKYTPGALECFQITDQVCISLLQNGLWGDARAGVLRQVFPCPRAPEPPVCRRLDFS